MSSEVMPKSDHRMHLNNYLQKKYRKRIVVVYDVTGTGLMHRPTWEAIACINGLEYGRGSGTTKDAAREAARLALSTLKRHGLLENRSELISEGEEATGSGGDRRDSDE